jgi:hypothetical protein
MSEGDDPIESFTDNETNTPAKTPNATRSHTTSKQITHYTMKMYSSHIVLLIVLIVMFASGSLENQTMSLTRTHHTLCC